MPRPSYAQSVALVDFMEQHPQLARGRIQDVDARHKANYLWKVVVLQLNAMNGCKKDISTWKKYWNDKKGNAKKNAAVRVKSMDTRVRVGKVLELSDLEFRILNLIGEDIGDGVSGGVPPFQSKLGEGECSSDAATTPLVAWMEDGDGSEDEKPTVDSLPDSDSEMLLPSNNSTTIPVDTVLLRPDAEQTAHPRFRSALDDAAERLVAIEERRVGGEARLAQGVQGICSHLVATKNEASEVARAQIAAALRQQEAAREQAGVAREQAEAARAQIEAARAQTEAARAQTEAARALTEVARALMEAIREPR